MKADNILQIPADTLLAEELANEDVAEVANLTTVQTGVPGTIFISTTMGGHGPRVNYFFAARALAAQLFGYYLRRPDRSGQ